MHPSGWIELIRTIPLEIHTSLAVLMQNGAEINVQSIVRLEEQFLVVRGRTAGSVDGGLIFFMPYDQISTLMCYKPFKEEVVHTWFNREPFHSLDGSIAPVGEAQEEPGVVAEPEEIEPGPVPGPAPVAAPPSAPAPARPVPAPAAKPAPAGKPEPAIPSVAARPAPGPQAATTAMTMNSMVLPAKAAMIERLRKKAQTGGPA